MVAEVGARAGDGQDGGVEAQANGVEVGSLHACFDVGGGMFPDLHAARLEDPDTFELNALLEEEGEPRGQRHSAEIPL
jgi:hypothetical protein